MARAADATIFRHEFARRMERDGQLTQRRVSRAFRTVPRDHFLPDVVAKDGLGAVYSDQVHITAKDAKGRPTSSSSQPGLMAQMLERLDVRPGQRVLEIGAGTGYNAALIAELVGPSGCVVTIDVDPEVANAAAGRLRGYKHVQVIAADGLKGWSAGHPYDRIVVTAEPPELPQAWHVQLAANGLLQVPVRLGVSLLGWVFTFRRTPTGFCSVSRTPGSFMPFRDSRLRRRRQETAAYLGAFGGRGQRTWTVSVTGDPIRRLDRASRVRLGAALQDGHHSTLAASAGLLNFIECTAPPDQVVTITTRVSGQTLTGLGLIESDGKGLAAAMFVWEKAKIGEFAGIYTWGTAPQALIALRRATREWDALGRPESGSFHYEVAFGGWPDGASWRLRNIGRSFVAAKAVATTNGA